MNDQIKRRIKTKHRRGVPLDRIIIDTEATTGIRLTVAEVQRVIEEPIAHAVPLTPAELRSEERRMRKLRCLNLHKYGWRQQDIAEELGVCKTTVYSWLKAEGRTRTHRRHSELVVEDALLGHEAGVPVRLIARHTGASESSVYRWISNASKSEQS